MTPLFADLQTTTAAEPLAAASPGAPTNQDIIDAAKAAYGAHQGTVDASAFALANIINKGGLTSDIQTLDGTDWSAGGVSLGIADPIFDSSDVRTAIGTADSTIKTYSVGVFAKQLSGGGAGTVGVGRSLYGQSDAGVALDIDLYKVPVETTPGENLQLGQWTRDPSEFHDKVYGLYIKTTVQTVMIGLKIVLDVNLRVYGFVGSAGAKVSIPLSTMVFGGTAKNWK